VKRHTFSITDNDYVIILDKVGKPAIRKDTFMGETVSYDKMTEELQYTSPDIMLSFDSLNKVESNMSISVTQRDGSNHQVELVENIIILK